MTVLIVSHLFEPSVNRVISELDKRGTPWARLNCEEFPLFTDGEIHLSQSRSYGIMKTSLGSIDTREISSVWFRRLAKPAVIKSFSDSDKDFIRNECNAFLNGFFDLIDGCWINSRNAERSASKTKQLLVASKCGFSIPRTLISNSSAKVQNFVDGISNEVAFKPVSGFSPAGSDFSAEMKNHYGPEIDLEVETTISDDFQEVVFCQILSKEKLDFLEDLKVCPVTFQNYINKLSDVRVTIVGDEIFACRIKSQDSSVTRTDFRKMVYLDSIYDVKHEKIILSNQIEKRIKSVMSELGLVFGCMDLLETEDGEFVFLEVNPSGQWLWIETVLGYPISYTLADALSVSG